LLMYAAFILQVVSKSDTRLVEKIYALLTLTNLNFSSSLWNSLSRMEGGLASS